MNSIILAFTCLVVGGMLGFTAAALCNVAKE